MPPKKLPKFSYDYARPALTVDLAITTREPRPRVLLIRRKKDPFAGNWALPGGFVEENEKLADAARRELEEETGVAVAYLARVNFDDVKPVAADDAEAVGWFPLDDLPALAFDHAIILARARARLADRSG